MSTGPPEGLPGHAHRLSLDGGPREAGVKGATPCGLSGQGCRAARSLWVGGRGCQPLCCLLPGVGGCLAVEEPFLPQAVEVTACPLIC